MRSWLGLHAMMATSAALSGSGRPNKSKVYYFKNKTLQTFKFTISIEPVQATTGTASEQASSEKARASKPEYEQGKFWYNVYGHVRIPVQGATRLSQSCQPDLVTLDQRLVEAASDSSPPPYCQGSGLNIELMQQGWGSLSWLCPGLLIWKLGTKP